MLSGCLCLWSCDGDGWGIWVLSLYFPMTIGCGCGMIAWEKPSASDGGLESCGRICLIGALRFDLARRRTQGGKSSPPSAAVQNDAWARGGGADVRMGESDQWGRSPSSGVCDILGVGGDVVHGSNQ